MDEQQLREQGWSEPEPGDFEGLTILRIDGPSWPAQEEALR